MMTTTNTIDHATLELLIEAKAVRGATIFGQAGGWAVTIEYGMSARTLAAKRGAIRLFRQFETLVNYLKNMGIFQYQVDARDFDPIKPKELRAKRSDASTRLKNAHQAASYKTWLAKEIQASIDDQNPAMPHEEVANQWATERAALLKKIKKTASENP